MLWYERTVHDKILRPRPPHPQGMPGVVEYDIGARNHDVVDEITIRFGTGDFDPKYEPGRVVASAAELPPSGKAPAPFHPVDRAHRRQRPRNEIVSVAFVDFS